MDSNRFPLQNSIKKILDDPDSRPELPGLDEGSVVGDDNFGEADHYDTGKWSDIALNNGNVVVEVHNTTDSKSLYYRVGKVDGGKINWGESHYYDKGVEPSVAITDDGLVIEVHKSQGLKHTLWYRVGNVEGNEIKWRNNDSADYRSGVHPSVAVTNSGLVVEVHQSQDHETLWYHVGKVEGNEIKWENNGESIEYEKGIHPSVAITNDGLVVEVHQSPNPSGAPLEDAPPPNTLWYRVGRVKSNGIIWVEGDRSKSTQYDNGAYPSVAITNDRLVVEVHQSQSHNTLWYRGTGQVNNNTIDGWDDKKNSQNFGDGTTPRVACNGWLAVETHSGADNQLLSSVLTLPAFRGKWTVLEGDNSYCYCACNSASDNKDRHASSHTMNVKEGAPYFYAVLTKDDDTIDFPTGAVLTIEGPDGTKYNRDIQEENQLVIMSGSSVRCLIVKDPKPGDWKMTMTVPEGVGFHCECNTVPSKDPYKTITTTLSQTNQLQKRGSHGAGWYALAGILTLVGGVLGGAEVAGVIAVVAIARAVVDHFAAPGQSNVATAVENQITAESPSQPTTAAMATALANTAQTSSTATPTPVLPNTVRVATWNVYHRTTRGTRPMDRILSLLTETVRNDFDIIVFQEVPQSLLRELQANNTNAHQQMNNVINNANQRYEHLIMDREYPTGSTPASSSTNGYLIVYNTRTLRLTSRAVFYEPNQFLEANRPPYVIQARPPVQVQFNIIQTNTDFGFYTWHAEAPRAITNTYPTILYNLLRNQGGHWIIAGDLNVIARNLPPNLGASNNALHHYEDGIGALDHVISDGTVDDASFIALNDPRWDQLFYSDVHYVLFARIEF